MGRSRSVVLFLLPLVVTLGCQAISELTPTQPNGSPSPTPSLSPLTIAVILPTPAPTPTPKPTPTPGPDPTPTPPPSGHCSLPASNPANPVCGMDSARLGVQVEAAITQTTRDYPQYFDFNSKKCENCYLVTNLAGYINGMVNELAAQGVCAIWDGEELAVKDSNGFSEQYDILLADNHIRRMPGAYRGDCTPAIF